MKAFKLKILASNKIFFEGEAVSLTIPFIDGGEMCFMANHENSVVPIDAGVLRAKSVDGEEKEAVVGSGFLEFLNNTATLVCISAETMDEIDEKRAGEAKLRAEEELRQKHSYIEYHETQMNLARAMERLKYKNRHGMR